MTSAVGGRGRGYVVFPVLQEFCGQLADLGPIGDRRRDRESVERHLSRIATDGDFAVIEFGETPLRDSQTQRDEDEDGDKFCNETVEAARRRRDLRTRQR